MDNPNNSWVYVPPSPPEVPPPPPPAPRGLLAPPAGKNRSFALGLLCVFALLQIAGSLLIYLDGSDLMSALASNPLNLAFDGLNVLLFLLVLLKFLLPGWEPHRKTLAWLLGISLVNYAASFIYGMNLGFVLGAEAAGGVADGTTMTVMRVGAVIAALFVMALRPQFWLLIGIWSKKSMEKLAGLFSFIALGWGLLAAGISIFANMMAGEALFSNTLWTVTLPGLAATLCWGILCFTWPVLERPVLEKGA